MKIKIKYTLRLLITAFISFCFYYPAKCSDIIIDQNTTYSGTHIVNNNIIVEPGITFTVTGTIEFSTTSKVIVKRTAILIVDGGHLVNHTAGTFWLGVEVWGDEEEKHSPLYQGMVRVINEGVIENALVGVKTWRANGNQEVSGYRGGIVRGTDAEFRNNIVAVQFLPYDFASSSSVFETSLFVTNNNFPAIETPDYFVRMEGVRGIGFKACVFINENAGLPEDSDRGSGIYAANSDILIYSICTATQLPIGEPCPEEDILPSVFEKLYYGVYGINSGAAKAVHIDNSLFDLNYKGVYLSALDFARITQNEFIVFPEVFPFDTINLDTITITAYGMLIEFSTGYQIEENLFKGWGQEGSKRGTGLIVEDSGPDDNMVYNNYFDKLFYSALGYNRNRNQKNSEEGLSFKCNDFTRNHIDIIVYADDNELDKGIAKYQGADIPGIHTAPAGNTFTDSLEVRRHLWCWSGADENKSFYYRHATNNDITVLIIPVRRHNFTLMHPVANTDYHKGISCPSNLGTTDPNTEEQLMAFYGSNADSAYQEYITLLDDGNTNDLTNTVISTTNENATEVYSSLMQISPFLSDTVLKTTIIREDVLDNNMIYDIMLANPQSGKSDKIMDMLEDKNDPMSGYMLGDIYDGRLILGDKENLEAEIAHWKRERFKTFSRLFRYYYSDTVSFESNTPLITLLQNANYLTPRYQLVLFYTANHQYTEAGQKLQSIPVDFSLTAKQQSEHQGYTDLIAIFEHCYINAVDLFNPSDSIVSELFTLYLADVGKPSAYARNLLIAAGELDYVESITIKPNPGEKSERYYDRTRPATEDNKTLFNIYPNPASGHLIVEHPFNNSNVGIKIFDNLGRYQKSVVFDAGTKVSNISVSELTSGIYFLQIFANEQFVESKKITILR